MKKIMFYRRKTNVRPVGESTPSPVTLAVLFAMFLCGLLIGGAGCCAGGPAAEACRRLALFLLGGSPLKAGAAGLGFMLFTVVTCLFFGLSPLGSVPLAALMLVKGMRYGIMACTLLREYAIKGLIYEMLIVLPGASCAVYASLLLAGLAVQLSRQTAQYLFLGGSAAPEIKKYLPKAGKACAGMALGCALDALAAALFSGLF